MKNPIYKKSYSRKKKGRIKDWAKALQKDMSDISADEMEKLVEAASRWDMCAVGNLCAAIPRGGDDTAGSAEPDDDRLKELGLAFCYEVENMDTAFSCSDEVSFNSFRKKARKTHAKIEARATVLLTEMGIIKPKKKK